MVNLVMTDQALLGNGTEPATVPTLGSVPAGLARKLAAEAATSLDANDKNSGLWVRRLYTAPGSAKLTAMDSRARVARAGLSALIRLRDGGTCRMPWCDALIRHIDHVTAYSQGGETSFRVGGRNNPCLSVESNEAAHWCALLLHWV